MKKKNMLDIRIEKMKGLSPLDKLKSGFSYVEDENGNNIKSVSQTAPGKDIKVKVTDGTIYAKTISTDTNSIERGGRCLQQRKLNQAQPKMNLI